ncbi:transketolase C-terminal domain-containing protein [Actinomadura sp. DC4]|uniref:transketolase family protein n=1 Tax=Actinomadura sp. DC4 TaxID=3055069 RepID=UPI0025B1A78B|nr:transketolase C-terminal domain-containing protein [Actinomadura sp. DC4]MDN3356274.1 transketolase C-terminal domain-containing protein [Actinomadura sp. DC4]
MTIPTREAYRDLLVKLMADDPRLYCLDSDTGLFAGVDFGPAAGRYVNVGIAEHNLMGVAAGLAASGKIPFVNTMATFATTRALESLKVDIAYSGLPVRVAATHGGLSAGHLGPTHHALEDLAIMRTLPGFTVVTPADATATEEAVAQSVDLPGPVYLRLGRKATPALEAGPTVLGRAQTLREGTDLAVFACGPHPVLASLAAADLLAAGGVSAAVLNVHTLKPLDVEAVVAAARDAAAVITVEEHWRSGGLGGAVAETLSEHAPKRVARIGMPDTFAQVVGGQEHLLDHYGITGERIAATALTLMGGTRDDPDLSRV